MENIYIYGYKLDDNIMFSDSGYAPGIKNPGKIVISKFFNERLVFNFSLSLVFVILMWLSANSFFYLPFTPVPFTMQVFTVLFASFALGPVWSFISQMQYILLGIAGAPLFAGFKSGLAAITGPSGGYIMGFAVSSLAAGIIFGFWNRLTDKRPGIFYSTEKPGVNNNTTAVFMTSLTSLLVIYSFGYIHLASIINISGGIFMNPASPLIKAFNLGILPFVLFDMLKIVGVLVLQKLYNKQALQEK